MIDDNSFTSRLACFHNSGLIAMWQPVWMPVMAGDLFPFSSMLARQGCVGKKKAERWRGGLIGNCGVDQSVLIVLIILVLTLSHSISSDDVGAILTVEHVVSTKTTLILH